MTNVWQMIFQVQPSHPWFIVTDENGMAKFLQTRKPYHTSVATVKKLSNLYTRYREIIFNT